MNEEYTNRAHELYASVTDPRTSIEEVCAILAKEFQDNYESGQAAQKKRDAEKAKSLGKYLEFLISEDTGPTTISVQLRAEVAKLQKAIEGDGA